MTSSPDINELIDCCRILFGPELQLSEEFLRYLQINGIKNAYRQKARETHPDMVRDEADSTVSFYHVRESYEKLVSFVLERDMAANSGAVRDGGVPKNGSSYNGVASESATVWAEENAGNPYRPSRAIRPFSIKNPSGKDFSGGRIDRLYSGSLPQRKLLFGNFLFYCGLTNWRTITRILTWQRRDRPRVGEIGVELGLWNENDVTKILQYQLNRRKRFAEAAFELGYISSHEFEQVLAKQAQLQKKFGRILVEKSMVNTSELSDLLFQFRRHHRFHDR